MDRSFAAPPRRIFGTALLPGGQLEAALVEIEDGRIGWVERDPSTTLVRSLRLDARRDGRTLVLTADAVLAPAFVDVHCHGAGGGSAHGDGDARGSGDAHGEAESIRLMARTLRSHGVGAFLATTMTAPLADLLALARGVRRLVGPGSASEAALLGLHLEGPALDPSRSAGHDAAALVSAALLARSLQHDAAAWRLVRAVTLAPELEGGLELVARLARAGIVASIGHTDATTEEALAAYAAGARSTTHLFNGMPPMHHRSPGPVGAALAAAPFIELICDGVHVDGRLLPSLARAIGPDRLLLVSDAVPLAGSRLSRASLAGQELRIRGGRVVDREGVLAGSRQLLDGMVRSAVRSGVPLEVALCAATENPARLLGLMERGRLAAGALADLVVVARNGRLRHVLPWTG